VLCMHCNREDSAGRLISILLPALLTISMMESVLLFPAEQSSDEEFILYGSGPEMFPRTSVKSSSPASCL